MGAFYQISDQAVSLLKKDTAISVHFLPDKRVDFELTADLAISPIQAVYDPHKAGA
jgi:hypothetical protein